MNPLIKVGDVLKNTHGEEVEVVKIDLDHPKHPEFTVLGIVNGWYPELYTENGEQFPHGIRNLVLDKKLKLLNLDRGVKTRDGRKAVILDDSGPHPVYPIIFAYEYKPHIWNIDTCDKYGRYNINCEDEDELDLVNV